MSLSLFFGNVMALLMLVFFVLCIFPIRKVPLLSSRWGNFGWALVVLFAGAFLAVSVRTPAEKEAAAVEQKKIADAEGERSKAIANGEDRDAVTRIPEEYISLENFKPRKGGFDTVAVISGRLKNTSQFPIKDVKLRCYSISPSGTMLNSDSITIYKVVPARGHVYFSDVVAGRIDQQSGSYQCTVRGALIAN
jgi:hypothetical protein